MIDRANAFVLMPFDPEFAPIYEDLIKPALEEAGYDVTRADSLLDQQNILRDIVRGIATACLVVADLTTLNPNVLYELGLCHGLGIPTIMLAQSMEEVPFDLRTYRIQTYSVRFDLVPKLRDALKQIGQACIAGSLTFGSPITDFLPQGTSIARPSAAVVPAVKQAVSQQAENGEEAGFLDMLVEGLEAAEELTGVMSEITQETAAIGDRMGDHTVQIETLTGSSQPGTAAEVQKIARVVALDITQYSRRMEEKLAVLDRSVDALSGGFSGYIAWLEPESEKDVTQVEHLRDSMIALLNGTREGLKGIRSYRQSVGRLRGISREMNRASRDLGQTLNGIVSALERVEAFCVTNVGSLEEKIQKHPGKSDSGVQVSDAGS